MKRSTYVKAWLIQRSAGLLARYVISRKLKLARQPFPPEKVSIMAAGRRISGWIFRPPGHAAAPLPVYINFHGGGYIIRAPRQDDHICSYLAEAAGCIVVNIDYETAPQHPFPAAPLQAYEAACWVMKQAGAYGWDAGRIAVGGQSAGGALAAAVAMQARDKKGPSLCLQVLHYAALDLDEDYACKPGARERRLVPVWLARLFSDAYTPSRLSRKDPLASPLLASDLAGIAPALVITAELDPLAAEGKAYATKLARAGVPVAYASVQGSDHAYTHFGTAEATRQGLELISTELRKAFVWLGPQPGSRQQSILQK